jgi:hypothetical protein
MPIFFSSSSNSRLSARLAPSCVSSCDSTSWRRFRSSSSALCSVSISQSFLASCTRRSPCSRSVTSTRDKSSLEGSDALGGEITSVCAGGPSGARALGSAASSKRLVEPAPRRSVAQPNAVMRNVANAAAMPFPCLAQKRASPPT